MFKKDTILSIIILLLTLCLSIILTEDKEEIVLPAVAEAQIVVLENPIPTFEEEIKTEEEKEKKINLGEFKLTAYCKCEKCCGKWAKVPGTASGASPRPNHTIAAPKEYEFGTQLLINNQVYTVEDRGSAIKGNRIDIYFSSHSEALDFCTQYSEVYLIS